MLSNLQGSMKFTRLGDALPFVCDSPHLCFCNISFRSLYIYREEDCVEWRPIIEGNAFAGTR